jgi:uncharacterized protein DUF1579
MKKYILFTNFVILACSLTGVAIAQSPAGLPKPGPECKRLGFFVGKWVSEADVKPSDAGPGSKFTVTEACDWYAGNFAVICHSEGEVGGSIHKALTVWAYDIEQGGYVHFETNNWGQDIISRGKVEGDTWTWESQYTENGKAFRGRFTLKQLSADAASFKYEAAMVTEPLKLSFEGKQTRQK